MQYSQKYALVSFLEFTEVNTEFMISDWPLHVTLAGVFAIDLDTSIEQKLIDLLADRSPVTLVAGRNSVLGETEVVLMEKNDEFQDLHDKIINLLELNGARFNNPEFIRSGFYPHVSVQGLGKLCEGDEIKINTISFVDMFNQGDWRRRKVLGNFQINSVRS